MVQFYICIQFTIRNSEEKVHEKRFEYKVKDAPTNTDNYLHLVFQAPIRIITIVLKKDRNKLKFQKNARQITLQTM